MIGIQNNNLEDIKYWSADFNDKYKTVFMKNKEDCFVVAKSIVNGMGISWGSQFQKIKKNFGCSVNKTIPGEHYNTKVLVLNTLIVPKYLDTVEIHRVSESARHSVREYKKGFADFVSRETVNADLTIFDSYIESGREGIKKLVKDVARMDYTLGYERIADILYEIMTNRELTLYELKLSNKIHDIADHLAKNQTRLGI